MKKICFLILTLLLFIPSIKADVFRRVCVYEKHENGIVNEIRVLYEKEYSKPNSANISLKQNSKLLQPSKINIDLKDRCPEKVDFSVNQRSEGTTEYIISTNTGSANYYTLNSSTSTNPFVKEDDYFAEQNEQNKENNLIIECPYSLQGHSLSKIIIYRTTKNEIKAKTAEGSDINVALDGKIKIGKSGVCPENIYISNKAVDTGGIGGGTTKYNVYSSETDDTAKGTLIESEVNKPGNTNIFTNPTPQPINFCEQNGVKTAFKIVGVILFIAKLLIPLIIIVFGILDFYKALVNSDDKVTKDSFFTFLRRILAGIIIFFIPTLIDILFNIVDDYDSFESEFASCESCLIHPMDSSKCSVTGLGNNTNSGQSNNLNNQN